MSRRIPLQQRLCPECGATFVVRRSKKKTYCTIQCAARTRERGRVDHNRVPVIDRVLRRCHEDENGCWIWEGYKHKGYGQITLSFTEGRSLTHHVTYEHFVGPIPEGLELDHLCRNPPCCNPWHLEPVTHAENLRRAEQYGLRVAAFMAKTHCRNGHEYTAANTHIRPDGRRRCRACAAASARRQRGAA